MINVKLRGLESSRRALELLVTDTRARCKREVRKATISTRASAKKNAPRASPPPNLQSQIEYRLEEDGMRGLVTSGAYYAQWVEGVHHNYRMGRAPGRWPPVDPIREWVVLRGLDKKFFGSHGGGNIDAATYLVRRKIGLKGTPAQPHIKPAFEEQAPKFEAAMKRVFGEAAKQAAVIARRVQ